MLSPRAQAGFTLVEILLVLAISGLLFLIVIAGRGQQLQQQQFSDGIERTRNNLELIKNEANAAYTGPGATGQTPSAVFFGREVVFTRGSSQYKVCSMILSSIIVFGTGCETYNIPWQVTFNPSIGNTQLVIFARDPTSGVLMTYVPPHDTPVVQTSNPSNYTASWRPRVDLAFSDGTRNAVITVDAPSNSITRTFQ